MAKEKKAKGTKPAKTSKNVMVVDFTKDTSEGGRTRFKEGDYKVKVASVKTGKSEQKGTPYVELKLEMVEGKYKGKSISDRCYITDAALWRIRSVYEAMGKSVPKKKVSLDFNKLVGGELGITISDEEYEKDGKSRITSRVTDFIDLDTLAGSDDDEDEEDDDDEDDDEEEDLEELDVDDDL